MRNYPTQILNAADTATQTGSAFFVGQSVAGSFCPVFALGGTGQIIIEEHNQ